MFICYVCIFMFVCTKKLRHSRSNRQSVSASLVYIVHQQISIWQYNSNTTIVKPSNFNTIQVFCTYHTIHLQFRTNTAGNKGRQEKLMFEVAAPSFINGCGMALRDKLHSIQRQRQKQKLAWLFKGK